jgi:quercetin dioxygenase-like cupin family protein
VALLGATLLGAAPAPGGRVAAPVGRRYGLAMEDIEWTRLGPGVWQHRLALSPGAQGDLYLLKLAPGCRLPLHGHAGELTVVLTGTFTDSSGEYRVGDVQEADAGSEHQPMGDGDEGCICLVADALQRRPGGLEAALHLLENDLGLLRERPPIGLAAHGVERRQAGDEHEAARDDDGEIGPLRRRSR